MANALLSPRISRQIVLAIVIHTESYHVPNVLEIIFKWLQIKIQAKQMDVSLVNYAIKMFEYYQ